MAKRISAKEGLEELINIKNEMVYNNSLDKYKNVNKFEMTMNKSSVKNYS